MSPTSYQAPQKRARRTKAEIDALDRALYRIVAEHRPVTVRQVFCQCVSRGLTTKPEAEYNNVGVRLLTRLWLNRCRGESR